MENTVYPIAYGCKNKDENIRANSRSGGVFTALSDYVLNIGGVIYGCALDKNFMAVHKRATTKQERDEFRGSKYVQSVMGNTYLQVKEDLNNSLNVMFSGTPCQVDGLKRFLSVSNVNMTNLITVDLVCHGVPSPKVWGDYLKYRKEKMGSDIVHVDFRNKKDFGWKDHVETLTFNNGKIVSSRYYRDLFYSDYIIRRSCHECNYTSKKRVADITLADFWGIDSLDSSFNDNKGVSLILINSDLGKNLFDKISDKLICEEFDSSKVNQTSLEHPHYYKAKKEEFWKDYNQNGIEFVMKKYVIGNPVVHRLKEIYRNHK